MTERAVKNQIVHRWYMRPVLFVADVNRALHFYIDKLGFEKRWHEGDGAGKVCHVNRGECEIILCEDATPRTMLGVNGATSGLARLFLQELPEASGRHDWYG